MSISRTPDAVRAREAIAGAHRWQLTDLYADDAAWRAARDEAVAALPLVRAAEGRLGTGAAILAGALDTITQLQKTLVRLYVYAGLRADEDTRAADAQAMQQEMQQLYAQFQAQRAYVEPEVLRIGGEAIEAFLSAEPRLAPYAFPLRDILRRAPHTLSDAEERLLAAAAPAAGAAANVFTILANADFPYPVVTTADGRSVVVNQAGYADLRTSPVRADRQAVMEAFFGALGRFGRTLGTTLYGSVQRALFYARARRHTSTLAAALDGPNIPVAVYEQLIDGVRRHLPTFHRYLRLRRRMLELADDLRYHDLYAPLVASVTLRYTPEEAQAHVRAAMAPLGEAYTGVLDRAFAGRWIDWLPSAGKRAGAYSSGAAYDVHPYILLNYLGRYSDMSTLAHELGHTMHSYLSNRTQPYPTAQYHTFVAEVASTFNEALLREHLLRTIHDRATRLSLLGTYLESLKGTVFRQTQFAEFELRVHERAWRGQALTGESLATLYLEITRQYYGHDARICVVDDEVAHEWSYIPHFYRDFYVFQYATSFTAAEALSARVLAGDDRATRRYLTFLAAGGSDYPIELLRAAGIDMTSGEPLDLTMARMNAVMDAMEAMLEG